MCMLLGRLRIRTEMRQSRAGSGRVGHERPTRPVPARLRPTLLVLFLLACTPTTTRPDFMPLPEAPSVVLYARPPRVAAEVQAWLTAQGLQVELANTQDAYVETAWFEPRSKRSIRGDRDPGDLAGTFKIRCWADPDAPGKSRLTVEAVYRPVLDPSRPERDLEVLVPPGHEGAKLVERMIDELKKKLGT